MDNNFVELQKGGYGYRYYFNAGLDKVTGNCDEEGIEVYALDSMANWHLIATIPTSKTIQDIEDMTDGELDQFLTENGIF